MKIGRTNSGTGIICENKFELTLIVSAIYDMLDIIFWHEVEDECVDMTVGGMPVYLKDKLNKKIDEVTLSYRIEEIKAKDSLHVPSRYVVLVWGVSLVEILNLAVSQARLVAK